MAVHSASCRSGQDTETESRLGVVGDWKAVPFARLSHLWQRTIHEPRRHTVENRAHSGSLYGQLIHAVNTQSAVVGRLGRAGFVPEGRPRPADQDGSGEFLFPLENCQRPVTVQARGDPAVSETFVGVLFSGVQAPSSAPGPASQDRSFRRSRACGYSWVCCRDILCSPSAGQSKPLRFVIEIGRREARGAGKARGDDLPEKSVSSKSFLPQIRFSVRPVQEREAGRRLFLAAMIASCRLRTLPQFPGISSNGLSSFPSAVPSSLSVSSPASEIAYSNGKPS